MAVGRFVEVDEIGRSLRGSILYGEGSLQDFGGTKIIVRRVLGLQNWGSQPGRPRWYKVGVLRGIMRTWFTLRGQHPAQKACTGIILYVGRRTSGKCTKIGGVRGEAVTLGGCPRGDWR